MVELITRYSNNPTVLDDLKNACEAVLALDDDDEPELGGEHRANGRRWPVANRLATDDLQPVVDGYQAGRTASELAESFEISPSSVDRLLRRAGAGGVAYLQIGRAHV